MSRRGCAANNAQGLPCRTAPLTDRPHCLMHDPDLAVTVAAARRVGGLHRNGEAAVAATYELGDLRAPEGRWRLLDVTVHDTLKLPNSPARSRVLLKAVDSARELAAAGEAEELLGLLRDLQLRPVRQVIIESALDREPPEASDGRA